MSSPRRFFNTAWAYGFWALLFMGQTWHDWKRLHFSQTFHATPVYTAAINMLGLLFCLLLFLQFGALTTNRIERTALVLMALSVILSLLLTVRSFGTLWLPSRVISYIFLLVNGTLTLLAASRSVQVHQGLTKRALGKP